MKFTVTRSNLLQGVQTVYRSGQAKSGLPVLNTILFQVDSEKLTLTSSDIDLTIQCRLPANTESGGEICLPARQILDIVRCLPDTPVQIENNPEANSVKILYDNSEINIKGYPPEHFPAPPELTDFSSFELPQGTLKEMIKQTIYAVSQDKTRPLFTGVFFEKYGGKLRLVATDTHRLALREADVEVGDFPGVIVPSNSLNELTRVMRQEEEKVSVMIGRTHISFTTADSVLISRLITGQFPAYQQIIPTSFSSSLVMNREELSSALARASLLINEDLPILRFNFSREESFIFLSAETGWIKEQLKASYEGEGMEIFFNARYLIETLRVLSSEEVAIHFTSPLSAAIIKPAGREDYLALLLPARPKSD
ncbi:MAG: DNA polymerase III subunit beta [Desulfotomaculales bacterium]